MLDVGGWNENSLLTSQSPSVAYVKEALDLGVDASVLAAP
jgi:hypothetical protein